MKVQLLCFNLNLFDTFLYLYGPNKRIKTNLLLQFDLSYAPWSITKANEGRLVRTKSIGWNHYEVFPNPSLSSFTLFGILIQISQCFSFENQKYEHDIFRITLNFLIDIMHKTPHILSLDSKVDRNLLANHQRPSTRSSPGGSTQREPSFPPKSVPINQSHPAIACVFVPSPPLCNACSCATFARTWRAY